MLKHLMDDSGCLPLGTRQDNIHEVFACWHCAYLLEIVHDLDGI